MPFPFAAVPLGLSAISSGFKLFGAGKEKKQTLQDIENYPRQELKNVFKNLKISTKGSDLIKEEASRITAGMVDIAKSGGIRGVLSALPKIQETNNRINKDAAVDIDKQIIEKERLVAGDDARIQQMQEQREREDLAGLGAKLDNADQNLNNGFNQLINTGFAAGNMLGGGIEADPTPKISKVTTNPFGLASTSPFMKMPSVLTSADSLFDQFKPKVGTI
ncbi:hypothetical protein [Flagellimonas nanhaiensis]|uniref:Uncharacterized protein n=1 Tax=Flagellimonas nanhaiensis TaxID=2292706 RepID=A0A371JKW0_9FLAO|nr:hypothetical protein [Allomuricauda nanhaiensis]RDY57566.1 hypothetical protein DX873_18580 [Allomuricauda nanhaiensis]